MTTKRPVSTELAPSPRAGAPYSQAIVFGDLVFASGQLPIDPATSQLVAGGIAEQTERTIANLARVLEAAGSGLDRVIKTTVFLIDHDDWPAMNEVYARYFGPAFPARSAVTAAALSLGARVEIEAVAHR